MSAFRRWPTWAQWTAGVVATLVVVGIVAGGEGDKGGSPRRTASPESLTASTAARRQAPRCRALASAALDDLRRSLLRPARLVDGRYVVSRDRVPRMPGFARNGGLVIVSARLGARPLVWAATRKFALGKGGLIVWLDPYTRGRSVLGADASLAGAGVSMATDGVSTALSCP